MQAYRFRYTSSNPVNSLNKLDQYKARLQEVDSFNMMVSSGLYSLTYITIYGFYCALKLVITNKKKYLTTVHSGSKRPRQQAPCSKQGSQPGSKGEDNHILTGKMTKKLTAQSNIYNLNLFWSSPKVFVHKIP